MDLGEDQTESQKAFRVLQKLLRVPANEWEHAFRNDNLKIFRRKYSMGSEYTLKCELNLRGVPKHIAFKVLSDLKLRSKWDPTLQSLTVLENDDHHSVFSTLVPAPGHVQTREVLLQQFLQRDFPKQGSLCLVHRSTQHEGLPECAVRAMRATVDMDGMTFEDGSEFEGTKVTWILKCDLNGCIPRSILNDKALKFPRTMHEALVKACADMIKGNL